ncbi:F0F1 ATP synthase subunit A [Candidatus Woesebacteria bacterium]|nr:F0F1 ATP synthase subunit A [Candidatus Woesebacteria bacterium]
MSNLHISISAETLAHIGPLSVSNSMLTSWIVSAFIILLAVLAHSSINSKKKSRLYTFFEMLVDGVYNFAAEMTGSRSKAAMFLPLVLTFFLWIALNNWAGLLPGVGPIGIKEGAASEEHAAIAPATYVAVAGTSDTHEAVAVTSQETVSEGTEEHEAGPTGVAEEHADTAEGNEAEHATAKVIPLFRAGTADLNTTIALAAISVASTQYFGLKVLGSHYWKKYFDFSSPIKAFVGILELILELAKIMSFSFRLFGNIFAGEVLLAVMMFLVPVVIPMPFYGLELFVGMIQGVVFAMLSLVFFNLATIGHGEEEH